MTDHIERVKNDRGLIKNIELAIPGFRGYRKREDIRASDSLLRLELANKLREDIEDNLEDSRKMVASRLDLTLLNELGYLIQMAKTIEGRIRHAEQGYSGISPSYRIDEDQLYTLYYYDWDMIQKIKELEDLSIQLNQEIKKNENSQVKPTCSEMKNKFEAVIELLEERHKKMADIGVI